MKWLEISLVIIKTWKNSLIKGLRVSPLVVISPLIVIGVIIFFQWANFGILKTYFKSSFISVNGSRELLAKILLVTTMLTVFITVVLHHISAAKNEFLKMFIFLPIKIGDIIFGYSFPFILVVTTLIAILLSPLIIALVFTVGLSAASVFVVVNFILMISATVCFILLTWVLIEIFALKILGENASHFTKLITPIMFLFFPLSFVLLSGDINVLYQILMNSIFMPSHWFASLVLNQSDIYNVLFSTVMMLTLFCVTLLLWWFSSRLIWQPTISTNSRLKFLKSLPFFSKNPVINITTIELKQSLRDIESLSYLFISLMMFLIMFFAYRQIRVNLSPEELFPLLKNGLYLIVVSVSAFAITSRARDLSAEWLFKSLPLTFSSYVSGKWLGNILILTPLYLLMAYGIMSFSKYVLIDLITGISIYFVQLLLFVSIAFLSGIIHKVKKQSTIDQLIVVVILGTISFIIVAIIQYTMEFTPKIWSTVNLNMLEVSVSAILTVLLLAAAIFSERFRRTI